MLYAMWTDGLHIWAYNKHISAWWKCRGNQLQWKVQLQRIIRTFWANIFTNLYISMEYLSTSVGSRRTFARRITGKHFQTYHIFKPQTRLSREKSGQLKFYCSQPVFYVPTHGRPLCCLTVSSDQQMVIHWPMKRETKQTHVHETQIYDSILHYL